MTDPAAIETLTDDRIAEMTYAERVEHLDGIVRRLEAGSMDLDETVVLFEQGVKLHRSCLAELEAAEGRLRELTLVEAEAQTSEA